MDQFPLPPELAADLRQVEQIIHERTRSRSAVISVAGDRILAPVEGPVRAALVLMAAATGDYQRDRVVHAAAAAELIHAATQAHDDLVDVVERRRGQPPVGKWNHGVALMVGDYLFALAAGEMALSPDPRVIAFYAQAVMRITESVLVPLAPLSPLEEARIRHLERVDGARASLFAAACRAGGACSGATPEQIEAFGRFGTDLGTAAALVDEAIDFGADPHTGGAPGASLRAGLVTLPLIFAAAYGDQARLTAAIDTADPGEQEWAVAEVRRLGLAPTRVEIARLAGMAHQTLAALPPGKARDALAGVVDYTTARAG